MSAHRQIYQIPRLRLRPLHPLPPHQRNGDDRFHLHRYQSSRRHLTKKITKVQIRKCTTLRRRVHLPLRLSSRCLAFHRFIQMLTRGPSIIRHRNHPLIRQWMYVPPRSVTFLRKLT